MTILSGAKAKQTLEGLLEAMESPGFNLEEFPEPHVSGYFQEGQGFTAFDNTSGHCFVEDFNTQEEALCWISSEEPE